MLSRAYIASKFAFMLVLVWLTVQAALSLHTLTAKSDAVLTDTRRMVLIAGGVAGEVRSSLKEFNKTEAHREAYYNDAALQLNATLRKANKTVDDLDILVVSTNTNFNQTFSILNTSIVARNEQIGETVAGITRASSDLDETIKAGTKTLTDADKVFADPSISATLKGTQETTEQLALTAGHLEKSASDIQEAVHRMTRPPSFAKSAGMFILDIGSKLGNIVSGLIK